MRLSFLALTSLLLLLSAPTLAQIAVGDRGCSANADCAGDAICSERECFENCLASGLCPGAAADTRSQPCAGPGDGSCGAGFGCAISGGLGDYRCILFVAAGEKCIDPNTNACDNSKGLFCMSGFRRGPTCLFQSGLGGKCGAEERVCERGLTCRSSLDGTVNVEDGSGVCGNVAGGRGAQCAVAGLQFCEELTAAPFSSALLGETRTVCEGGLCVASEVLIMGDYCGASSKAGALCDACEGLVCAELPEALKEETWAKCVQGEGPPNGCGLPFWGPQVSAPDATLRCVSKTKERGEACLLPDAFQREYVECKEGLGCVNGVCA